MPDFLVHDPLDDIPRQKFACVSILTPNEIDVRNRSYFEARAFALANHADKYPDAQSYDTAIKDWCQERQGDLDEDFKDSTAGRPHIPIMKIRGVFKTQHKASARCRKLAKFDSSCDIGVCPVGVWVPADGKLREDETDIQYAEQQMQELMQTRLQSQKHARTMFEQRKHEALQNAVSAGDTGGATKEDTMADLPNPATSAV